MNKWPSEYDFVKRNRWAPEKLVAYINTNACMLSPSPHDDQVDALERTDMEESSWIIDTTLAETLLFKALSPRRVFLFALLHSLLNNLHRIVPNNASTLHHFDRRLVLHHLMHFFDLNNQIDANMSTYEHLCRFLINFSVYLRQKVIKTHRTINRPNYFNLKTNILDSVTTINKLRYINDIINTKLC